ncbi:MAG: aldehyde dehydrogenase family protein, partial [Acidimicrobiia bacterium]|nr:aldehyde dehydrogenase family protein [Acidimicrobiia bacterium]
DSRNDAQPDTEALVSPAMSELARKKKDWAPLGINAKIRYLRSMRAAIDEHADEWVDLAVEGKRIPADSPFAGEEWISGPYAVLIAINAVIRTLEALRDGTDVLAGTRTRVSDDGRVIVEVFPVDMFDRLLLSGYRAEVWMDESITTANLRDHVASFYKQASPEGRVGLILGAGNISSIPLLDMLTKMFTEGQVVIIKMNPVNSYLGPVFEKICAELIADGYVRFVYGGAAVGTHLVHHEDVDSIHLTGSSETFHRIVYGEGKNGVKRRRENNPLITKPISAELGGVGPTFIVPGPWTAADFAYQAEHLATQKFHNAGFNCIASQVMVLADGWDGSDRLVDELRSVIRTTPPREPYYPGAETRHAAVLANHPEAELLDPGPIPRILVRDIDPGDIKNHAFINEFFVGAYATTKLPASDASSFVRAAVEFANTVLAGTLGAQFIVHPVTLKELGPVIEAAIDGLQYGSIGINGWTGAGYLLPAATWGAFPKHNSADIGAGIGIVHNAFMFDRPQKTVVHAPFHPFPRSVLNRQFHLSPKPPWFVTHARAHLAGERLTRFAADPGWTHLPGIFSAALRHK